jgi:hypothetical protein
MELAQALETVLPGRIGIPLPRTQDRVTVALRDVSLKEALGQLGLIVLDPPEEDARQSSGAYT